MAELQSPWLPREERQQHQDLKREAVLLAAARAFGHKGYKATRIDDIAEELHVTKPTIYYYFANKELLLLACIKRTTQMMADTLSQLPVGASPKDRVSAFLRGYLTLMTDDLGKCLANISEFDLGPKALKQLQAAKREVDAMLQAMIEDGIEKGAFEDRDPAIVTFSLFGAMNTVARWHRPGGRLDPARLSAVIHDLLLEGLLKRSRK